MCLQSGIPLKTLVRKFKDVRFEPAGFTNNPDVPVAKSIIDYVFRYIGMKYLSSEDREEIFGPASSLVGSDSNKSNGSLSSQVEATLASVESAVKPKRQVVELVATSADAPACGNCGSLMVRAGSCYSCPNCFATTGVCN